LKTIIYIDDNPHAGLLFKLFLEKEGYRVKIYDNTDRARNILEKQKIDLIITDLGLPGEDGLSFYKWLQSSDYHEIPVLIASGHAFGVDNELSRLKDIFVEKPILFPKLVERIRKIFDGESSPHS